MKTHEPATADSDVARILLEDSEEADRNSRLPEPTLDALRRSGAFALAVPSLDRTSEAEGTSKGGASPDPVTIARRLADLGRACPSAAWIAGTCVTTKTIVAANFDDDLKAEAFADPDELACGSGVPSARGTKTVDGYRVTGRWTTVSGCQDADWAGLGLIIDGAHCGVYLPIGMLSVQHTWQVAGMRATASNTLIADDILVPDHWVTTIAPPTPAENLLYGLTVLGPVVGGTIGALDVIRRMFASNRKPFMTEYARMGESPGARSWLAEATMLTARAERTMLAVAAEARDRETWTDADLDRSLNDIADAGRDCRSAVDLMLDLHGASGFNTANPLQRYWRDVSVGSRHSHLNPYLGVERFGFALAATHVG